MSLMDGTDLNTSGRLRAAPVPDNMVRKEQWLQDHPRDTIRHAANQRLGYWYECDRDGRQIAESNDLGMLIDRLRADFDTPGSREP